MKTKLKCVLLDDELPGLTYLKMLCEQITGLEVVKAYNSPEVFLQEIEGLEFDFCILDIEMPHMNGLQVANLLNGKPVIFTTAYKEYAAEAFDLNAIDYVRKPVTRERLQQALKKAQERFPDKENVRNFVQLNTDKGKVVIFLDQLCHIRTSEVDSRDKIARLSDGIFLTLKNISFGGLLELLPPSEFIRVSKKEIIALKNVQLLTADEIITNIAEENGEWLKLKPGDTYKTGLLDKMRK